MEIEMIEYPGYKHLTTYDMMKEVRHYQPIYQLCKGKKVLDIGANVGAFSYCALKAGAESIVMVEPSNRNFSHLAEQPFVIKYRKRISLINKCVVEDGGPEKVTFFEGKTANSGTDGMFKKANIGNTYDVETVEFGKLLETTLPEILKIDIEGGERELNWKRIPDTVEAVAVELHIGNGKGPEWVDKVTNYLLSRWPNKLYMYDTIMYGKYKTRELVVSK